MMESGKGREPWLLDHRTGTSDSEYTWSSVLRWEQERFFVATISGSCLKVCRSEGTMLKFSRVGWKTAHNSGPGWHVVSITELCLGDCACHPVSYPPAQSPTSHLGAT